VSKPFWKKRPRKIHDRKNKRQQVQRKARELVSPLDDIHAVHRERVVVPVGLVGVAELMISEDDLWPSTFVCLCGAADVFSDHSLFFFSNGNGLYLAFALCSELPGADRCDQ